MNIKNLKKVLSIQSESFNQFRMFAYIIRQVKATGADFYINDGNIYITKGDSNLYPCIVAHMDTVHEITDDLTIVSINGNLTGFNGYTMEQTGIGGDDKVGVFVALECLYKYDYIKIAFFRDEEVGCTGSYSADMDFFSNCSFVLQCDRRGNEDFIVNASGTELSSKDFQKAVEKILPSYNYKFNNGMMTDVQALKQKGLEVSCANISCGYYNPHQVNEYVNISDVYNCLLLVFNVIEVMGETKYKHNPQHKKKNTTKVFKDEKSKIFEYCECCMEKVAPDELSYLKSYNFWVCLKCKDFDEEQQKTFSKNYIPF